MKEKPVDTERFDPLRGDAHCPQAVAAANGHGKGMNLSISEKRLYPRFDYAGPVRVNGKDSGRVKNLSVTGISFILNGGVLNRLMNVSVELSPGNLMQENIEVVRSYEHPGSGEKEIGARFVGISDAAKARIRSEFILSKIRPLLNETKDDVLEGRLREFFLKGVLHHVDELSQLAEEIAERHALVDSSAIFRRFSKSVDDVLDEGRRLESTIDHKVLINKLKDAFREIVAHWIYQGDIVKRALEQPRGYPGDYFTLENIYDNESRSKAIGFYSDRYFLNNEYAVAVRGRKTKIQAILDQAIIESKSGQVKILDIACGSSREIRELLSRKKYDGKRIKFSMLDHDEEALDFSERHLPKAENITYDFIKENVLDLCRSAKWKNELAGQDVVYTIGLADYLPDRVLKKLIEYCTGILGEDGLFILTHKDIEQCDPAAPDWFCKWKFHPRTEKDVVALVKSSIPQGVKVADIQREESGRVIFVIAKK